MDQHELRKLLTQPEGPALDFKREWYHLDAPEPGGRFQRDELIRDVLALANGSTSQSGVDAHLVIGAGDSVDCNGSRELNDAVSLPAEGVAARITLMVNSACSPAIGGLDFSVVPVDGRAVGVLTVHASPFLHETTRRLEPGGRAVTKHVVFIRSGDTTEVACAAERDAIGALKRRRFSELRKVSPALFGAVLGALLGASAGISNAAIDSSDSRLAGLIAGSAVFSVVGFLIGIVTQRSLWIRHDWPRMPRLMRLAIAVAFTAAALWMVFSFYNQVVNGTSAG